MSLDYGQLISPRRVRRDRDSDDRANAHVMRVAAAVMQEPP